MFRCDLLETREIQRFPTISELKLTSVLQYGEYWWCHYIITVYHSLWCLTVYGCDNCVTLDYHEFMTQQILVVLFS